MSRKRELTGIANGRDLRFAPRRSTLSALVALSALALVLRYPQGHEQGVDSFNMHALAGAVVTTGSMNWLVNPLSYFGLSPFSYSPAVPVSTAAFAAISGLDLEPAILAYSLFLGVLSPLTAFLLGRSSLGRDAYGLALAFLISTAEGVVGFTAWTLTARGMFLVCLPLAISFFIRFSLRRENRPRTLNPLLLVLLPLTLVHAMWILLFPLLFAVWILYRIALMEDSLLRRRRLRFPRALPVVATYLIVCMALFSLIAFGPAAPYTLGQFPAFQSSVIPDNVATRVGLQIASLMGLGIALLPLGLIRLAKLVDRQLRLLNAALILMFMPVAIDPVYGSLLALPVMLAIAGLGWPGSSAPDDSVHRGRPRRTVVVALAIGLIIVTLPAIITIPRSSPVGCNQPAGLDGDTYNLALYMKSSTQPGIGFVADTGVEDARLEAVSGRTGVEPILSVGTLAYPWLRDKFHPVYSGTRDLVDALLQGHQFISVSEWLPRAGSSYDYYYGKHTFVLLQSTLGSPSTSEILGFYQVGYAVERCPSSEGTLFLEIGAARYGVYADGIQRMFWIGN